MAVIFIFFKKKMVICKMTGQQLIDHIKQHHLENLEIYGGIIDKRIRTNYIEFEVSNEELPYPEFKDSDFDEPAFIYKSKILYIDNFKNVSIVKDKVLNTSL